MLVLRVRLEIRTNSDFPFKYKYSSVVPYFPYTLVLTLKLQQDDINTYSII
jgi:hypothetical protein